MADLKEERGNWRTFALSSWQCNCLAPVDSLDGPWMDEEGWQRLWGISVLLLFYIPSLDSNRIMRVDLGPNYQVGVLRKRRSKSSSIDGHGEICLNRKDLWTKKKIDQMIDWIVSLCLKRCELPKTTRGSVQVDAKCETMTKKHKGI